MKDVSDMKNKLNNAKIRLQSYVDKIFTLSNEELLALLNEKEIYVQTREHLLRKAVNWAIEQSFLLK